LLTIQVYSRYGFEEVTTFTDQNLDEFPNEYFICIHATGWIHAIPYFKQPHKNVLNLVFDDVEKDRKKWIHEYVPITYNAIACTENQAILMKRFIDNIPDNSTVHVYCAKGQSRSPAVAAFIEEHRNKNQHSKFHNYKYNQHVYNLLRNTTHVSI
jgi:hypothetical protein